ncbi:MAG TPA: M23 family metallopeptidase [Prolixibacteraceae bacterium]|nr:M23 family metallopeptidase [Prolixibacteraceae bacterium]
MSFKKYSFEIIFALISLAIIGKFLLSTTYLGKPQNTAILPVPQIEIERAWGFAVDSVIIDTSRVRSGQSLSDILRPKGISPQAIDLLARRSKEIFDVRRIKAGNNYYLIKTDSLKNHNYMVYEESLINYIVFDLDSQLVYRGEKQVDTIRHTSAGSIKTSLWNAFVENGASPVLAVELSDIYAWTIDFFGIQPGDKFKVLYDGLYIEDQFAGIGRIHAASFKHSGATISAYYYNNESNQQQGYFDNDGNSLQKAFLKAPLKFSRISSKFSNSRMHPVLKYRRAHHGVDYAAPTGTPVHSIGDGTVVKKAFQAGGGGNYINIKHNSVYTSQYMHLSKYAPGMAPGVRVKQGQLIGYVGATGLASGPHLDFRIYKNGSPVDPLKVEAPPVEPIKPENLQMFSALRDSLKSILDTISISKPEPLLVIEQ